MSILDETIRWASGHYCKPNGVGDYTLVCPEHGTWPGFIPFMVARVATPDMTCPLCLQPIGERVEQHPNIPNGEVPK